MKYSFFTKIFSLIIIGALLGSLITLCAFNYYTNRTLIQKNRSEMIHCVTFLADIAEQHFSKNMDSDVFEALFSDVSEHFSNYYVYVFDADGTLLWHVSTPRSEAWKYIAADNLDVVLNARYVASIPTDDECSSTIVASPTRADDGTTNGAIFLVCPMKSVNGMIRQMTVTLLSSLLVACVILIVPAYLASRMLSNPIMQITKSAKAIARGDFSVKAPEAGNSELAQLGASLNYMSAELSATISDLTLEKNRLDAIMNGLTEGIIASNSSGSITHCNRAAQELLSEQNDTVDFRDTDSFAELYELMKQALACNQTLFSTFSTGKSILHFTASPLYEFSGCTAGGVALINDITESERLETTRREYVANVSHELRTPVAAIRSLADALNDGLIRDDGDKQRYYGYILRESLRLSRLINDLLDLSRLQADNMLRSNKKSTQLKTVRLDEIASDAVASMLDAYPRSGRKILTDTDAISLMTDPDRLEQLLLILLDNAFRHSSVGDIELQIKQRQNKAIISVSNEGYIANKDLPHLFERFYKIDKSHSGNGTGLGLAIASEITELLSGEIFAESSQGRVRFTVMFDIIN